MALPQKVFIFNVSTVGGGQYQFDMFIQNPSFEKYVRIGDTIEDTNTNRYTLDTWATFPADFTDGTRVTVTFVNNDVAPTEDVDYNSDWFTEGLEDIRPQVQTTGTLSSISIFSGQDFEYTVTATWDSSVEANKAVVGDYVADSSGTIYEITFIDGTSRFAVPCRIKEVETYGNAPNSGTAALYRPTDVKGLYTGVEFSETQINAVRNRDNFLTDDPTVFLKAPTDGGDYGNPDGNVSGVTQGDTVEDGFDKVESVLAKLAPEKPEDLSQKTLSISGTYTAYESDLGTPTLRTNVIDNTQPTASTPNTASEGFYDATQGTLTAEINTVDSGNRALTVVDDTGVYGALNIIDDFDFHLGTAGKENFWYALIASVQATSPLSLGENTYRLTHSLTGSTPLLTFYVDDPQTPSISGASITGSGTGTFISGVPSLDTGDTITADFTVDNAVGQHYNATRIARAQSSYTTDANDPLPGTPPASGASVVASIALSVENNRYIENTPITCIGYNSKGGIGQQNVTNNIRIDTISNEQRLKSGQGQYPTLGSLANQFGDPFDSTVSLATAGNEELQLLNGTYGYPSGNYTTNTPVAGPDYSSVPNGTFSNFRWVTFNVGLISSASAITLNFTSTQNFGSNTLVSNFALYVLVDGASPTAGWIDGNAAYPGVGDPTNNGDPALVIGNSSATSKRITFGTSVKTGDVYVRIGIPTGDAKRFGTVNLV